MEFTNSVIIPTFNRRNLLARAVESVAVQTTPPAELIVVDDGSTDGTTSFLEAQTERLRLLGINLQILCQNNLGPAQARNRGLRCAKGNFISFLDSDDAWQPSYIATVTSLLHRYPTAGLAFCACAGVNSNGMIVNVRSFGFAHDSNQGILRQPFETLVRRMPLQTSCVTLRRKIIEEVGMFDSSFCVGEDWDLWFRIAKLSDFTFTTDALALNYSHAGNIKKFTSEALYSDARVVLKHLPDVTDVYSRKVFIDRLNRLILLLLEQTMREKTDPYRFRAVLKSGYAPRSLRFRAGFLVSCLPKRFGWAYANGLSWFGHLRR